MGQAMCQALVIEWCDKTKAYPALLVLTGWWRAKDTAETVYRKFKCFCPNNHSHDKASDLTIFSLPFYSTSSLIKLEQSDKSELKHKEFR